VDDVDSAWAVSASTVRCVGLSSSLSCGVQHSDKHDGQDTAYSSINNTLEVIRRQLRLLTDSVQR
jgi:hypothetical protein